MGPGTELKRLLAKCGIVSTTKCKCDMRAEIMDMEGCEWCKKHIAIIVDWMREEAEERKLPFSETGAKFIVLLAIRNAKKKERILNHG